MTFCEKLILTIRKVFLCNNDMIISNCCNKDVIIEEKPPVDVKKLDTYKEDYLK